MKTIYLICGVFLLSACGGGDQGKSNFGSGDVTYKITLNASWSKVTHPNSFPTNPHFSNLVGATHNVNTHFWQQGHVASAGIEKMAETGSTSTLLDEIKSNIILGDSNVKILSSGISSSPGSTSITLKLSPSFSYLTLVMMLAPSPDWFVGINAYNLMPNGNWINKETTTLFAYDAGSDSGAAYTSANADTNPKQDISKISRSPFLVNGVVVAVGTLTIERIK